MTLKSLVSNPSGLYRPSQSYHTVLQSQSYMNIIIFLCVVIWKIWNIASFLFNNKNKDFIFSTIFFTWNHLKRIKKINKFGAKLFLLQFIWKQFSAHSEIKKKSNFVWINFFFVFLEFPETYALIEIEMFPRNFSLKIKKIVEPKKIWKLLLHTFQNIVHLLG